MDKKRCNFSFGTKEYHISICPPRMNYPDAGTDIVRQAVEIELNR